MAGVRDVHRVLGEDHRIVVGEGDRLAAELQRRLRDHLRRRLVHQPVHLLRLRDVPVLAELAREVAARGAERQHARARIELVERLFLDRVDAESGRAAVGGEQHPAALHLAHEAQAALPLVQPAVARAQVALDAAVRQRVPPAAGDSCSRERASSLRISAPGSARPCSAQGACPPASPPSSAIPAGSGACRAALSQTCGRKVARLPSHSRIRPSSPARICASRSASSAKRIGLGAESSDTSTSQRGHSSRVSLGKRGSSNAAARAFDATSCPAAGSPRGCRCSRAARRPCAA